MSLDYGVSRWKSGYADCDLWSELVLVVPLPLNFKTRESLSCAQKTGALRTRGPNNMAPKRDEEASPEADKRTLQDSPGSFKERVSHFTW